MSGQKTSFVDIPYGKELSGIAQHVLCNQTIAQHIIVVLVPPPGSAIHTTDTWNTAQSQIALAGYNSIGLIPPGKMGHLEKASSGVFTFKAYTEYLSGVIAHLMQQGYQKENICISTTSMGVPVVAKMMYEKRFTGPLLLGAPISNLGRLLNKGQGSDVQQIQFYADSNGLSIDMDIVRKEIAQAERRNCGIGTILSQLAEEQKMLVYANRADVFLSNIDKTLFTFKHQVTSIRFEEESPDKMFNHKFPESIENVGAQKITQTFLEQITTKTTTS